MKKQDYISPQTLTWELQIEASICEASGGLTQSFTNKGTEDDDWDIY